MSTSPLFKLPQGAELDQDTESVSPNTKGIDIPKGALLDENSAPWTQLPSKTIEQERPTSDKVIDFLRPFVGPGIGTAVGVASSPFITPVGGAAAGLATSALADTVMQKAESKPPSSIASKVVGIEPGSTLDNITSALENDLGGKLSESVLRGVISRVKGILSPATASSQVENAINTAGQQNFGDSKIGSILRSIPGVPLKRAAGQELTQPSDEVAQSLVQAFNQRGKTKVSKDISQFLLNNNSQIGLVSDALKDPKKIDRILRYTGKTGADATTPLREFALRDALNDPKAGVEFWNNPDYKLSLNKLFSGAEQARVGNFLDNLAKSQAQGKVSRYVSFGTAGAVISSALLHNHVTPWMAGLEAVGIPVAGYKLSRDATTRLLTNPTTSRLMTAMVSGAPLGVSESFAASQIAKVLQGTGMFQVDTNGKEIHGHLDKDNKFIPD